MHGLRLLLTCRRDPTPSGEVRDAVDIDLVSLLTKLGHEVHLVANDPDNLPAILRAVKPQGVVLSGGNDVDPKRYRRKGPARNVSKERDAVEFALVEHCRNRKLPLVALCRGLQVVNVAFGGTLSHDLGTGDGRTGHVRTSHAVRLLEAFPKSSMRGRRVRVNSFHNHGVVDGDLAPGLVPMAISADGVVEALRHPSLPILAVQWHPERAGTSKSADAAIFSAAFGAKR